MIQKTRHWNLSLATLNHTLSSLCLSLGSPLKSSGLFASGGKGKVIPLQVRYGPEGG